MVSHVLQFLKYVSRLKITHEDVQIGLFMSSLQPRQRAILNYGCCPKSITSFTGFINLFFNKGAIKTPLDESFISNLTKALETIKSSKENSAPLFEEQLHEEEKDSKELQDLDDETNKGSLFHPFGNKHVKHSVLRTKPLLMKSIGGACPPRKLPKKKGRIPIKYNLSRTQMTTQICEHWILLMLSPIPRDN
jgi:hypothetical protein